MAGVYVHIPFCKQACHYCNFHFSTTLKLKDLLLQSIVKEIEMRREEIGEDVVDTVYFGGGTPSMLVKEDLAQVLTSLHSAFNISDGAEITLEANPDDVTSARINEWRELGFNRISLGIQSFFDLDLEAMNRAHSASEAHRAMEVLLDAQFDHLSLDLIYGSQTTTDEMWRANLEHAAKYNVGHLSCYALTVEEGTVLAHKIRVGEMKNVDDGRAASQFSILQKFSQDRGYRHYEISNLALEGHESRHNSSYWSGAVYLGVGPAAHSYDVTTRSWNVAHNHQYIKGIQSSTLPRTVEHLSKKDRFNELIMTRLRTSGGLSRKELVTFGSEFVDHFEVEVAHFLDHGDLDYLEGYYRLSPEARFRADGIAAQLFSV